MIKKRFLCNERWTLNKMFGYVILHIITFHIEFEHEIESYWNLLAVQLDDVNNWRPIFKRRRENILRKKNLFLLKSIHLLYHIRSKSFELYSH